MKKNKQKDLIRSILPSKARRQAKFEGRKINRRTRKGVKQALNDISPEDEFDDSKFCGKVSKVEGRHKSEMKWRVSSRRGADKIGPIKRITKKLKKTCKNDSEAHAKLSKFLEPGKNLITRHAMEHAEWYLDAPECEYYLPPETDRDRQAREQRQLKNMKRAYGEVIWGKRRFKRIIKWLIEHKHKQLNRILKKATLTTKRCSKDDPCHIENVKIYTVYEYFDPQKWSKWMVTTAHDYNDRVARGEKVRLRKKRSVTTWHSWDKCPNRLLAFRVEDYLIIAKQLSNGGEVCEKDFKGTPSLTDQDKRARALCAIKIMVEKYNL